MSPERVAIVAVHGIANQRPGQTVRELARLLCHGGDGPPRYVQGELNEVLVPVEKLEPGRPQAAAQPARSRPGAPSGFYQARLREQDSRRQDPEPADLGMALNDYLLDRLVLPERDSLYQSTRISLHGRTDDRTADLYEMYWADLSRLGPGGLRVLWSLYQLFFHLGTLAADVVDQIALAANGGSGWRVLQRLHAWLAWLMKGPAALLQLAMALMVLFAATALVAPELRGQLLAALFGLGAVVLAAVAALGWVRAAPGPKRWIRLALLLAAALGSTGVAIVTLVSPTLVPRMYFAAAALCVALLGAFLVERYSHVTKGVRVLGHVVVLASVAAVCVFGTLLLPSMSAQGEWMITAALNVVEYQLAALLLVWAVFVVVQIAALLLGGGLGLSCGRAARASLDTARIAVIGSSAFFAVLSLVLWSMVSFIASRAVPEDLLYLPILFRGTYRSVAIFLEDRVQTLGGFFTPLVLAFTLLAAAALLVLLPSLIEEISPSKNPNPQDTRHDAARRLGNWLDAGLRVLGTALRSLVPLGAVAGGIVYLAFVVQQFYILVAGEDVFAWLSGLLALFEGETLVAAGKWLAGGAVTIAALGARFTQTFGRLRVALDAVLDIDNYFGDPPNRQPPRARIYSRFAALLAHLRERGYARVVIVAHSQGTVIGAELLRYLQKHDRLQGLVGGRAISLVTVGSPLRDLYAARFPLLYGWIGPRAATFAAAGPAASEVGATEWVNAYRSGDYVGRCIWTPDTDPARFAVATIDTDGTVRARRAGDRTEFCLGAGAHTHYFSNDAVALAAEIDRLVAGRPSPRMPPS